MELDPKDYDVVKLLTKLKKTDAPYPSSLLAFRRLNYIRRVAKVGVGSGVAAGLKSTVRSRKSGSFTPTTGGLLEIALVAFIVAEAGITAYFYREKISEIFHSHSSKAQVQKVTSSPEFSSPLPEITLTEIPEIAGTSFATETQTEIIPTPGGVADKNDDDNHQTNSTPAPNGDNGNHFGQTPIPDRTKDPDNNNDGYAKDQSEGDGGSMDN